MLVFFKENLRFLEIDDLVGLKLEIITWVCLIGSFVMTELCVSLSSVKFLSQLGMLSANLLMI
jgi:hypothetical protein